MFCRSRALRRPQKFSLLCKRLSCQLMERPCNVAAVAVWRRERATSDCRGLFSVSVNAARPGISESETFCWQDAAMSWRTDGALSCSSPSRHPSHTLLCLSHIVLRTQSSNTKASGKAEGRYPYSTVTTIKCLRTPMVSCTPPCAAYGKSLNSQID